MSCHDTQERLAEYVAGELEDGQRAEIEAHLAQCAACARESDALRAAAGALERFAAAERERPVTPTDVGAILAMARVGAADRSQAERPHAAAVAGPSPSAGGARSAAAAGAGRGWFVIARRAAAALLIALGLAALLGTQVTAEQGRMTIVFALPGVGSEVAGSQAAGPLGADPATDGDPGDRRHSSEWNVPALDPSPPPASVWDQMERVVTRRDPSRRLAQGELSDAVTNELVHFEELVHTAVEDALVPVLADLAAYLVNVELRNTSDFSTLAGEFERQREQTTRTLIELVVATRRDVQLSHEAVLAAVQGAPLAQPGW